MHFIETVILNNNKINICLGFCLSIESFLASFGRKKLTKSVLNICKRRSLDIFTMLLNYEIIQTKN